MQPNNMIWAIAQGKKALALTGVADSTAGYTYMLKYLHPIP